MTHTETQLVTGCIKLLHVLGVPAWRNNSGATKIGKRFIKFGMTGSSDILGVLPPYGRFLAVECKMPGKKPTPEQHRFMDVIRESGGVAFVAYSMDDVEEQIAVQRELDNTTASVMEESK